MSRIFLSHSSKDNFAAVAMGQWLMEEGWEDTFLDLDPTRGIHPGQRWEQTLYEHAHSCEAVIFLVSRNWLASDWCRQEFALARKLNKRVFVALIDDTSLSDAPAFLKETHQAVFLAMGEDHRIFDVKLPVSHERGLVTFSQEGLLRLKNGLQKAGLDARFFPWPPSGEPDRSPYRGLDPLESIDAGVFFGRDAPVVEVLDTLRGLREAACPRLLVLLGASGAGKSSFLRAGLLPRLSRDDANFFVLPIIRPERAVLTGSNGFVSALASSAAKRGLAISRAQIRDVVAEGGESVQAMLRQIVQPTAEGPVPTIVVAVDQAEELFRPEGVSEGENFLGIVRGLVRNDNPAVAVLFCIRTDSYDELERVKPLEGLRQHTYALLPMPRGAYQTVIENPLRRLAETGRKFEIDPGLTQALLLEIEQGGGNDALPLLAFTLEQLYRDHAGAGRITKENFMAFGGLKGAIDAAVARVFAEADKDDRIPRDHEARLLLLRRGLVPWLAGVDPETKSVRRRIARGAQIPEEARPIIDLLVEQRLLTRDIDGETGVTTLQPAHEALLRQWGALKGWLEDDFAKLSALEGVKRASRDWDANAQSYDWLAHSGGRLDDIEAFSTDASVSRFLDDIDAKYILACRAKENAKRFRELEDARRLAAEQKRVVLRTRLGLVAALILLAIAGVVGAAAWQQRNEARQSAGLAQQQEAAARRSLADAQEKQSRFIAERAGEATTSNESLRIALEGLPPDLGNPGQAFSAEALSAASLSALRIPHVIRRYFSDGGKINLGGLSPDGKISVITFDDNSYAVYDVAQNKLLYSCQLNNLPTELIF